MATINKGMNGLVKGYVTTRRDGEEIKETLYAVTEDGRIFRSPEQFSSVFFDRKEWTWERVYEMPANAEYIGQYPAPKNIVKWA